MTSFYKLSCRYLQRFGRNFKRKVSACIRQLCAPNYRILAFIVAFDFSVNIACMQLWSPLGNRFLSPTKNQTLAFGHKRYGRPTLARQLDFLLLFLGQLSLPSSSGKSSTSLSCWTVIRYTIARFLCLKSYTLSLRGSTVLGGGLRTVVATNVSSIAHGRRVSQTTERQSGNG